MSKSFVLHFQVYFLIFTKKLGIVDLFVYLNQTNMPVTYLGSELTGPFLHGNSIGLGTQAQPIRCISSRLPFHCPLEQIWSFRARSLPPLPEEDGSSARLPPPSAPAYTDPGAGKFQGNSPSSLAHPTSRALPRLKKACTGASRVQPDLFICRSHKSTPSDGQEDGSSVNDASSSRSWELADPQRR